MGEEDLAKILSSRSLSRRMSFSSSSRRSWASASIREVLNTQADVFQRSGRENDDEELIWAAIERLPTYDRLKKGVLMQVLDNGNVDYRDIDVVNLGVQDKKRIMDSVLKIMEEDNEKFLLKIRERSDM